MLMSRRVSGRKVEEFRGNVKTVRGPSWKSGHRGVCSRTVDVGVERGEINPETLPGRHWGLCAKGGSCHPRPSLRGSRGDPNPSESPRCRVCNDQAPILQNGTWPRSN